MKNILIKQINFEQWANTELLASIKIADNLDERTLFLFSHIISVSKMWLSRVKKEDITTTLFEERTIAQCEIMLHENTEQWLAYPNNCNELELNRVIQFTSPLDGIKREIVLNDAVLHVVHHSSYHRGQIVSQLKGKVEKLPLIIYIAFSSIEI